MTDKIKYTIDLSMIKGQEGIFYCPECGLKIDPDDGTDVNYRILKNECKNNSLQALILECCKCKTRIRLIVWGEDKVEEVTYECQMKIRRVR